MIGRTNSVPGGVAGGSSAFVQYQAVFTPDAETCVIEESDNE